MSKPWILRDEGVRAIFDHVRNIGIAAAVVVAADNASRWFSPPWIANILKFTLLAFGTALLLLLAGSMLARIRSNLWLIVYALGLLMLTAGLVASALT